MNLKNDITRVTLLQVLNLVLIILLQKYLDLLLKNLLVLTQILTTSMKSVGETMSIGRSFAESLQKGFASLEYDLSGLDAPKNISNDKNNILEELKKQSSQRLLIIGEALRIGISKEKINNITKYDPWFIDQIS